MNKPPAFQFYPKDFLTDDKVAVMNLEEKGAYIVLLSYCWNNNGLTKNQKELKNMCGNPRNWERIWGKVSKCFYEKKGKYFNKRLEKEYKKQKEWRKKSQEGGIQSGITRGKKLEPNTKGGSKMVQTKLKPTGNSSVCSLHSSSTLIKNLKICLECIKEEFTKFWEYWPSDRCSKKSHCEMKFKALMKQEKLEDFWKTIHGYSNYIEYQKKIKNFDQELMLSSTWLNNWESEKEKYIDFKYKPKL